MLRWTGVQDIGWRGCTVCVIGVEPTFDRRGCDVEDFEVEELEEVMRKYCAIGGVCKIDIVELIPSRESRAMQGDGEHIPCKCSSKTPSSLNCSLQSCVRIRCSTVSLAPTALPVHCTLMPKVRSRQRLRYAWRAATGFRLCNGDVRVR